VRVARGLRAPRVVKRDTERFSVTQAQAAASGVVRAADCSSQPGLRRYGLAKGYAVTAASDPTVLPPRDGSIAITYTR
jgi:hypothetical protein